MSKDINGFITKFENLGRMKQLKELLEIILFKDQKVVSYITADEIKGLLDKLLIKAFLGLVEDKPSKQEDCSKCDETQCPDHPSKMN